LTLAGSKAFLSVRNEVGDQPGLFAYADVAGAMALLPKEWPGIGRGELEALHAFKELVNPKAFRALAYDIGLEKGTLATASWSCSIPAKRARSSTCCLRRGLKRTSCSFTRPIPCSLPPFPTTNGQERWEKLLKVRRFDRQARRFQGLPAQPGGRGDGEEV